MVILNSYLVTREVQGCGCVAIMGVLCLVCVCVCLCVYVCVCVCVTNALGHKDMKKCLSV